MGDSEFEYSDEEYGNVVNSSLQQAQVRGRVPSAPEPASRAYTEDPPPRDFATFRPAHQLRHRRLNRGIPRDAPTPSRRIQPQVVDNQPHDEEFAVASDDSMDAPPLPDEVRPASRQPRTPVDFQKATRSRRKT